MTGTHAIASIRDEGVEDYVVRLWYGILAPAGTPEEFTKFIAAETPRYAKIVKDANIPAQ